jgi:F-type H+-transporting ATPase subunit alpha
MIIYAAINGYLADIPVEQIKKFEKEFYDYMDTHHPEVGKAIKATGALDDDTDEKLKNAILEFKKIREQEA